VGKSALKAALEAVGVDAVMRAIPPQLHERLRYEWRAWARPEQLAPATAWRTWLILAGRGFGKTRTGAEWVREEIESGRRSRIALVAPTAADARDVMVEGESGLLAISPPWFKPLYEPSKRRLTWPNGAIATVFTADEPERLRGPQHDGAWCDELAAWRYPDAWDMLQFGLRLGDDPRCVVTTTPKPVRIVRELLKATTTAVTRGSTYDNADNLAPAFLDAVKAKYEGTRLGRQELYAEVLDDVPGALWTRQRLDELRTKSHPDLARVVVAVDPSGGHTEDNDEQGIVVAGLGVDGHAYVLADRSCRMSPDGWGKRSVIAYSEFSADRLVYEQNYGGEMCEHVLSTAAKASGTKIATKMLHASRGKVVRAEPVAALYEQGKVHHVGAFDALEDEQCQFTPLGYDGSPNRVDALVWALTELMLNEPVTLGEGTVTAGGRRDEDAYDEEDEDSQWRR
jgi:phage terminase large subunit-like protein